MADHGKPHETKDELLAAVAEAGLSVSDAQLARWHRSGLLPRPEVRSLGRGRGTQSLYPAGSARRVVRVAQVHAAEHRLAHAAWRLWWEDGGALSDAAREFLMKVARDLEHQRGELVALVEGDVAGDPETVARMDELHRASQDDRLPQPLSEARRRVGARRFPTVTRILLEIATNRFGGFEDDPETGESDGVLVEKSWGLERARTDRLASAGPWLDDDIAPSLTHLASLIAATTLTSLADESDERLDLARNELVAFMVTIGAAAQFLERLFGPDAFGYGMVRRLFNLSTPRAQAAALLGWLTLSQDKALRDGMLAFVGLQPQAEATHELFEVMAELRQAVPALAEVLSTERLATAQVDAREDERLREEIRAVADANRAEVDAFLSRFPELDELQRRAAGEA